MDISQEKSVLAAKVKDDPQQQAHHHRSLSRRSRTTFRLRQYLDVSANMPIQALRKEALQRIQTNFQTNNPKLRQQELLYHDETTILCLSQLPTNVLTPRTTKQDHNHRDNSANRVPPNPSASRSNPQTPLLLLGHINTELIPTRIRRQTL